MAANPIPRQNDPRYRSNGDQFTAWRSRLVDTFAAKAKTSFVKNIEAALEKTLDEGTRELKPKYPIILPRAAFEEYVGPMVFKTYGETEVEAYTKRWRDGVKEDIRKHLAPGPSFLKDMNGAASYGQAAVDTVEKHFVDTYLAGTSGTHGFDGAAFFCAVDATTKKINPKDAASRSYGNHKALTLKKANPIAFIEALETHFESIPNPSPKGYLKLEVAAILAGSTAHKILRDVAEQDKLEIQIINGANTERKTISNRWAGRFSLNLSLDMPADKMLVWAKGAQAGVPHMVHSLLGLEEMPGGEFMAADQWQAMTGTWMQPLTTMIGPGSEHCEMYDEILVKAAMDMAVVLHCPWSALLVDLTIE